MMRSRPRPFASASSSSPAIRSRAASAPRSSLFLCACTALALAAPRPAAAQSVSIDTGASARGQIIDGFGTCLSGDDGAKDWFKRLYFDDLRASMLRVDLTPSFKAPYSDHHYNSPWYSNDPSLPGPENNNVRTYTGPSDYGRSYAGRQAAIAVMGPDLDQNVALLDFSAVAGGLAQLGESKKAALGDFKLVGSLWSPSPWLKVSSGNTYGESSQGMPTQGTSWPFIWGGNFAGGMLDVSGQKLAVFDDGSGPTSALTQFARTLAATLRGFQTTYGVKFYAVSIQNELNFEEFYNSATYPQAPAYLAALKAARAELDRYPDLAPIRLMGPEDLLGDSAYSLWEYGSGATATHKNLQYLAAVAADPEAKAALAHACIHGYASDGVSAAGASPTAWGYWLNGWTTSPAPGIPANVRGVTALGLKSWMTETSGEETAWLAPASGFPGAGAFSIAVKLHQALTAGSVSAWLYWQLSDGSGVAAQTLTDAASGAASPKYVAAKHFFHDIRPGAVRVGAAVSGAPNLLASAWLHEAASSLTVVLVNTGVAALTVQVAAPAQPANLTTFDVRTSRDGSYWQSSTAAVSGGKAQVAVPGYGVATLVGFAQGAPAADAGAPADAAADAASPADVAKDAASVEADAARADAGEDSGGSNRGDASLSADASEATQDPFCCGCGGGGPALPALGIAALGARALRRRSRSR